MGKGGGGGGKKHRIISGEKKPRLRLGGFHTHNESTNKLQSSDGTTKKLHDNRSLNWIGTQ